MKCDTGVEIVCDASHSLSLCLCECVCVCVRLMTHDMEQGTPLALDQDRRCQTLEAVQNTAEEVPRKAYCGDTV